MKTLFILFFVFAGGGLFAVESSPANAHLLKETTIPEFKLEQANLSEAIDTLRELTKRGEDEVNFVISPELKAEEIPVSFSIRGISGMDALATILQMSGTRAELKRGSIWILPNP